MPDSAKLFPTAAKPRPGEPLYALAELYEAFYNKPWKTENQFAAMEKAAKCLHHYQTFRTLQEEHGKWFDANRVTGDHAKERMKPSDRHPPKKAKR